TIIDRDFIPLNPDAPTAPPAPLPGRAPSPIETDPRIVGEVIAHGQEANAQPQPDIRTKSGPDLVDFILTDFQEFKRIMFSPRSHQAIMAGMEATGWLNDHLERWLGEKKAADALAQSVPNNVTSQMGLDLLHVADVIRPHRGVVAFLQQVDDENFVNDLARLEDGTEAKEALLAWPDTTRH